MSDSLEDICSKQWHWLELRMKMERPLCLHQNAGGISVWLALIIYSSQTIYISTDHLHLARLNLDASLTLVALMHDHNDRDHLCIHTGADTAKHSRASRLL